jgi:hypothetical protein
VAEVNDEQVRAALEEIEHELRVDDPKFVRQAQAVCRVDAFAAVTVFLLLAAGAVLLTLGVATMALVPWAGVVGARRHHRRPSQESAAKAWLALE